MKTQACFLFPGLIVAAAFLAAFPAQEKTYPVSTEVKDGVKTVSNPDYPRDGRFDAKLTEEMSCGEEGGPDAAVLNRPIEVKVDGQGRVFVMDWGDFNIKVYDGQGRFLRAIGRQGQGPGDFGTPAFFEVLDGDRICILDGGQRRVTILTAEGRYLSSFLVDGFHRNINVDGMDRLYLGKWAAVKEPDKVSTDYQEIPYITSIYRTDPAGKDPVHLLDLLGESVSMKSVGGGGSVGMLGGGYMVAWTVDPRGRIYGGCNDRLGLSAYGQDGKIEFSFGRKFTPRNSPDVKGLPRLRKTMPAFSSRTLVFDEEGNLWLELTRDEDEEGFVYDVFSPDGIYLKQVRIEQRVAKFLNGKVYSLVRPRDGYPSIKRYGVDLVPAEK